MLRFKNNYNREKIETILKNNNIYDDIKNIEYLNLNKIIIYFTSNKHILKIFCDNSMPSFLIFDNLCATIIVINISISNLPSIVSGTLYLV